MKSIFILFSVFTLVYTFSCSKPEEVAPAPTPTSENETNTIENCPTGKSGQLIEGQYIVFFKQETDVTNQRRTKNYKAYVHEKAQNLLVRKNSPVKFNKVYHGAFQGFTGRFSRDKIKEIQSDPEVDFVIQDYFVSLESADNVKISTVLTQETPWGITKVGQGKPGNQLAWVLDTGIDTDHPDLNVDVIQSRSFICSEPSVEDMNGHGTHVAGIIAAKDNTEGVVGVAPGNTVVGLKVMNAKGEGLMSDLLEGLDYVYQNAKSGDVVNLSLSGEADEFLDHVVDVISTEKQIYFAMAAGNENDDAGKSSPQRLNNSFVYTVSAMDDAGVFADFSNYGSCVDYCAPGVVISSTYLKGQYAVLSGTSMAAPHVAGMLLQKGKMLTKNGFVLNDPDGNPDPIPVLKDINL